MKITDIRFGMLRVPLKTPFKTALRSVEQVEDVVVMVHTDSGHVGYGSAPATAVITGDTHGSIVEAVRQYIAPRLIGQDIANLNRITHLNAMRVFDYDPFTVLGGRDKCTVGALRAQASDVDVSEKAITNTPPRDPSEPPITILSIMEAVAKSGTQA